MSTNVFVRLPGATDPVQIPVDLSASIPDAIQSITKQLGASHLSSSHLVVAPTEKKNGSIISPLGKLSDISFNATEDVFELWKAPALMSVCIYFKKGIADNIRDRKRIPIDMGSSLIQMIPTLQRVLGLTIKPFSIQYADHIDGEGRIQRGRWLHCSTPIADQNVTENGHFLCHPIEKLVGTPEQAVHAIVKGWMWKRSKKGERVSAKQKRWFILSNAVLYYYKKERDSVACGVVPLDYYVVTRKIQPKKKKYALLLTLSDQSWTWKGMTTMYKLQAESPDALEYWVTNIKPRCINAGNLRVFGIDIKELTARNSNQSRFVPSIVKECIIFICTHALTSEGIFRLSACNSTVEHYKECFDSGQVVNFAEAADVNVPAALLKRYFRELPEPLFTFSAYSQFEEAAGLTSQEEKLDALANVFQDFPVENYATSKLLFSFLSKVSCHQEENKMGATNLATVFGPNLLSPPQEASVQAFGMVNKVIEFIITFQSVIFERAELLNPTLSDICIPSMETRVGKPRSNSSWAKGAAADFPKFSRATSDIGVGVGIGNRSSLSIPKTQSLRGGKAPSVPVRKNSKPLPPRASVAPPPIAPRNSLTSSPSRRVKRRPEPTPTPSTEAPPPLPSIPAPLLPPTSPLANLSLTDLVKRLQLEQEERIGLQKKVESLMIRVTKLESSGQ